MSHEGEELPVQVANQQHGAFSELAPVDIGVQTDAASDHDFVTDGANVRRCERPYRRPRLL